MSSGARASEAHVEPAFAAALRELRLEPAGIFDDPRIHVWRCIPERENCTLDATLDGGRRLRFHIKRYRPGRQGPRAACAEACGIRLLRQAGIPTVPLVAWGVLADGRSYLITEDLAGFRAGDRLVEGGFPFPQLLQSTAELAAQLHSAGLHHRDLYLCHFFIRPEEPTAVRLIDAGRVRRLPPWPFARRWIIKDLAQFWYSAEVLGVGEAERCDWLHCYAGIRGMSPGSLLAPVLRKARRIARHDARLRAQQPRRNISLPESAP